MSTTLRLLILEDEPNDAELEIAEIEEAGYSCQWERVETREDFLARLDAPDYDLILSDYKLPSFDGLTALGLFLERKIDIPFILVSGTLGEDAAIESLRAGATDYVLKTRLSRLVPVVRRALKEHAEHRQRKKLEMDLRQAQKMESIGQLAGGVAHDFNNILQVIMGYASFAKNGLAPDSDRINDLKVIIQSAEKAARLTRQLLAFSRSQILQPVDLNLNQLIEEIVKMVRRIIGENIELDYIPSHRIATIHADPTQMEQVLLNLCVNARDAMPDGGKLTIETENVLVNGAFCETHPWAKKGRYILLSTTDTGCGMDKKTQDRIFEPFFTTKEEGKGTGMGLSTVYGIVKQHNGLIHVYSELGKGTTFKVYLPSVERSAATVGSKVEGPAPTGTETILLVEDNEDIRSMARRLLEEKGYTVLEAFDGLAALEVFESHSHEIALVLLDVVLPKLAGRKVRDRIKEIKPDAIVLFTSGYSPSGIHTKFILDEDVELLQKPYQPEALLRKIRELLDAE